jgi:hypothetical protein
MDNRRESGKVITYRRGRATGIAYPALRGFGREFPLVRVERLCPEIAPESAIDPEQINGMPGKTVGCPHSLAEPESLLRPGSRQA